VNEKKIHATHGTDHIFVFGWHVVIRMDFVRNAEAYT
jgi:hypothetical protein